MRLSEPPSAYGTVTACTGVAGLAPHAFTACTLML
jgi:hypothetical protein